MMSFDHVHICFSLLLPFSLNKLSSFIVVTNDNQRTKLSVHILNNTKVNLKNI